MLWARIEETTRLLGTNPPHLDALTKELLAKNRRYCAAMIWRQCWRTGCRFEIFIRKKLCQRSVKRDRVGSKMVPFEGLRFPTLRRR